MGDGSDTSCCFPGNLYDRLDVGQSSFVSGIDTEFPVGRHLMWNQGHLGRMMVFKAEVRTPNAVELSYADPGVNATPVAASITTLRSHGAQMINTENVAAMLLLAR